MGRAFCVAFYSMKSSNSDHLRDKKLFKHANRLVYSGSTDTIVVSSIPMNHQTNVLGQMKELEGFVGRTLFNFVRADYSLFTHCYHFYKIRFQCLLFTGSLSCTPFSRLNTTPKIGHEEDSVPDVMTCSLCFLSSQRARVCFFVVENTGSNTSKKRRIEDSPRSRACRLSRIIERRSRIARFLQNSRVFRSLMTTMMTPTILLGLGLGLGLGFRLRV